MSVHKKEVIRLLETIALYMEIKGENPFKVNAFRKAANALETDERSLAEIGDFTAIPGIGKSTAAIITEFVETGSSSVLEELKRDIPETLLSLLKIPGLGGKKIAKLHQELGIVDMDGLKEACLVGKVRELPGFGAKTEEKLLAAIEEAGKRPERLPLARVLAAAGVVERQRGCLVGGLRGSRAGSLRRVNVTVNAWAYVIASVRPAAVRAGLLRVERVREGLAAGATYVSLLLRA
ncbi:helix-hairpin-helix domain-containing protein, partial [Geobacillus stearothermophilus]|uniref:helix-hairpin-helix domain-containing protein n=1 Tax=Geobacillus stearothermophilus TaxID=1422 RepID=UPI002E23D559|nr:helix-hairpin-helix domain-containing protein [Geobacillus stearothermophilus]